MQCNLNIVQILIVQNIIVIEKGLVETIKIVTFLLLVNKFLIMVEFAYLLRGYFFLLS